MNKKQHIKEVLFQRLLDVNAFWSYADPSLEKLPDDLLIEKVMLRLDIDDINLLFEVFSKKKIKEVWIKNIIPLEPRYHAYSKLFGFLYFDIKNPDRYIKRKLKAADL